MKARRHLKLLSLEQRDVPAVTGAIFNDANGDGERQTGETGISGVSIRLTGTTSESVAVDRTATTGTDGSFTFSEVVTGTYSLIQTQPTGFVDGAETAGNSGGTFVSPNTISGIAVTTGQDATGYLFADVPPPVLSLTQATSASRVRSGRSVTLTYTMRNTGAATATDVSADINLGGLTFVSANDASYDEASGSWTLGDMAAGATETLQITATVPSNGSYRPSASFPNGGQTTATIGAASTSITAGVSRYWFLSSGWRNGVSVSSPGTSSTITAPGTPLVDDEGNGGGGGNTGTPPTTPNLVLAFASDDGTAGDNTTTLNSITLTGTTTPGATVTLTQTGATTTADNTGAFSFTGVPVNLGSNAFTATATTTGGTSNGSGTVTRQNAPTVVATPSAIAVDPSSTATFDLAGTFDDADITNTQVRMNTSAGAINIELFDRQAPRTVQNFLNYIADGDYTDSIFHRSVANFVIQGGGFTFETDPAPSLSAVPTDPAVLNEPDVVNRSNVRGTLAMAKLGNNPNSATSQFFFNLADNSSNLNNQNGGFTVFGRVAGAADQTVVDALAAITPQNQSNAVDLPPSQVGVFSAIPLTNYTGNDFPTDTTRSNYAIIDGITVVSRPEFLTYSIVSNSNAAAATVTLNRNRLQVTGVAGGTTTVVIRATDQRGATVDTSVVINVNGGSNNTTGPTAPTLVLASASDDGTAGDNTTTQATVTLTGSTTAGATLTLTPGGATTTADGTGAFTFSNVALTNGANAFTVQASNAGGTASGSLTVTRQNAPTVLAAPDALTVATGASTTFDVAGTFDDADITNTQLRMDTSEGTINLELFDRQAPRTVQNFLNYVNDRTFENTIFHRSVQDFVLQGGGYSVQSGTETSLAEVPADPAVLNEPDAVDRSNIQGTIAMAKLDGDPDSATNQFFFNLADNSTNLDNQNGGFTVFGRLQGTADQTIVDALAAIPTQDQSAGTSLPNELLGVFDSIPLTGYTGTDFPRDSVPANYARLNSVSIVSRPEFLTYSVVEVSDPTIATATMDSNRLVVQGVAEGTVTITIRAVDQRGVAVTTTVDVTVTAA